MNPVNWVKSRIDERTSWDGAVLIAVGVVILIAGPFAKLAAIGLFTGIGLFVTMNVDKFVPVLM